MEEEKSKQAVCIAKVEEEKSRQEEEKVKQEHSRTDQQSYRAQQEESKVKQEASKVKQQELKRDMFKAFMEASAQMQRATPMAMATSQRPQLGPHPLQFLQMLMMEPDEDENLEHSRTT